MFDKEDDDVFEFHKDDLFKVMEMMKKSSELLETCDTDYLCEKYLKNNPPTLDGIMSISYDKLKDLNSIVLNETLQDLVGMGLVDYTWSEESNDFVFTAKDTSGPGNDTLQ